MEIALLVRNDVGALLLYVNGKLAVAAQARERSFASLNLSSRWGGNNPEIALGRLVTDANKRNQHGPTVNTAVSAYDWSTEVTKLEIYPWTSGNSAKVLGESAALHILLDVDNDKYRGTLRYSVLDNEPDVKGYSKKNTDSNKLMTISNGVVSETVSYDYDPDSGSTPLNPDPDVYLVSAVQSQSVGSGQFSS